MESSLSIQQPIRTVPPGSKKQSENKVTPIYIGQLIEQDSSQPVKHPPPIWSAHAQAQAQINQLLKIKNSEIDQINLQSLSENKATGRLSESTDLRPGSLQDKLNKTCSSKKNFKQSCSQPKPSQIFMKKKHKNGHKPNADQNQNGSVTQNNIGCFSIMKNVFSYDSTKLAMDANRNSSTIKKISIERDTTAKYLQLVNNCDQQMAIDNNNDRIDVVKNIEDDWDRVYVNQTNKQQNIMELVSMARNNSTSPNCWQKVQSFLNSPVGSCILDQQNYVKCQSVVGKSIETDQMGKLPEKISRNLCETPTSCAILPIAKTITQGKNCQGSEQDMMINLWPNFNDIIQRQNSAKRLHQSKISNLLHKVYQHKRNQAYDKMMNSANNRTVTMVNSDEEFIDGNNNNSQYKQSQNYNLNFREFYDTDYFKYEKRKKSLSTNILEGSTQKALTKMDKQKKKSRTGEKRTAYLRERTRCSMKSKPHMVRSFDQDFNDKLTRNQVAYNQSLIQQQANRYKVETQLANRDNTEIPKTNNNFKNRLLCENLFFRPNRDTSSNRESKYIGDNFDVHGNYIKKPSNNKNAIRDRLKDFFTCKSVTSVKTDVLNKKDGSF